jgi:hypothetical protein
MLNDCYNRWKQFPWYGKTCSIIGLIVFGIPLSPLIFIVAVLYYTIVLVGLDIDDRGDY